MEYFIENKKVSESEYNQLTSTLTEIENTYHCAKTIGGGRNSYESVDSLGVKWLCRSETTNEYNRKSLEKIN